VSIAASLKLGQFAGCGRNAARGSHETGAVADIGY